MILINSEPADYERFHVTSYYSKATWFRLKLADYLHPDVKRVLYLDCDTIVVSDIGELLDLDMENCPVAAVNDTPWQIQYAAEHIGIDNPDGAGKYFNAGMMLIDVDAYRSYYVFERAGQILADSRYQCDFLDQDVLNIIFRDNWKELPCKWNLLNGFLKKEYMSDARWPDMMAGIKDRAIIYYSA